MKKRVILLFTIAMLFGTSILSGCASGQQASENSTESHTTSVVEDSVGEVTIAEKVDESPDVTESHTDTSVYDNAYTVDQYGNVRDIFGKLVSQIDPDTYEGSITYIEEDESSEDDNLNSDDFTYLIVDDEVDGDNIVKITQYNGSETDVVIPDTIDGRPVTIIGENAFKENIQIKSVSIPDSVKTIESSAFYHCDNLSSVNFGTNSQLNSLFSKSFAATSIEEFTVPKNCIDVSDPFQMCYNLKKLTILGKETRVYIDMWLPKDCVVYGYEGSVAQKKLFSIYGFTFKVIEE